MVETAITMPLFVFLILGTIQLALMHQARLLTKYAAYKAVRAGSLSYGRVAEMEAAALNVLLPMVSFQRNGQDLFVKTRTAAQYTTGVNAVLIRQTNTYPSIPGQKIAEVTVCGPTRAAMGAGASWGGNGNSATQNRISFDDPTVASDASSWSAFERTKLRIQLTFHYKMPIPFANMMLYHIYRGDQSLVLGQITRTNDSAGIPRTHSDGLDAVRDGIAATRQYIIPIRASYSMRMQSDLYPYGASNLPNTNRCQRMYQL